MKKLFLTFSLFAFLLFSFVALSGNDTPNYNTDLILSTTADITASTTQTQGNGSLSSTFNEIATVGNANDTVTLPSAKAGLLVIIINNGANTLQIFPASGDSIDEAAANASVTQVTGANFIYVAEDATHWNRLNASL